jgi:hypothetical protein
VKSSFTQPDLATVPLIEVRFEALAASTSSAPQNATEGALGALVLRGKLKSVREEYDIQDRQANVYSGEMHLGWIDYDVLPSGYAQNDTYILPIVEDMDWSSWCYPDIYGLALTRKHDHLLHFERAGLFRSATLNKRDKLADYQWFHAGEDQDVYIV